MNVSLDILRTWQTPPHVSTVTMATVPLNEGTQDHKPALLYFLLSPYIKRENKTGDREA
jgi:hypothetical protein